jgi:hypothetical protein
MDTSSASPSFQREQNSEDSQRGIYNARSPMLKSLGIAILQILGLAGGASYKKASVGIHNMALAF